MAVEAVEAGICLDSVFLEVQGGQEGTESLVVEMVR